MTLDDLRNEISRTDVALFDEYKWEFIDVFVLGHEEHLTRLGELTEYFQKHYGTWFINQIENCDDMKKIRACQSC